MRRTMVLVAIAVVALLVLLPTFVSAGDECSFAGWKNGFGQGTEYEKGGTKSRGQGLEAFYGPWGMNKGRGAAFTAAPLPGLFYLTS